ncbi:hypothetical protein OAO40_00395 [Amylibacter sp.]|nr:hypothetical protein [Amylibacter sp.]
MSKSAIFVMITFMLTAMGPAVSYADEPTIKSLDVRINGGTHKSEKYINSEVRFNQMKIDGSSFGSPSIRFKISQNPGKQISYALILSSSKTMLNINKNNNGRGGYDPGNGYKLWIKSRENINLNQVSNDFTRIQIKALKSMCGYFSSEEAIKKNIKAKLERSSNSYEKSVSRLVSKRAYREFAYLASRCKKSFDSKLDGYDTIKIYQAPKLCGKKVSPLLDLNKKTYEDMQRSLKVLGFYNSSVDGLFGRGSCNALSDYYAEKNKDLPILFSKLNFKLLIKEADTVLNKSNEEEKKAVALEEEKKAFALEEEKKAVALEEEKKKIEQKKPKLFNLKIDNLFSEYSEETTENMKKFKLRIITKGSDIDTSVVSKSLFGFENVSSIDLLLNMGDNNAYIDFLIDEKNTKIKFSHDGSSAFYMRLKDDSSSNISSGDFEKILEQLDIRDAALLGAYCSKITEVTESSKKFSKFVKQNSATLINDNFLSSPLSKEGVINIINVHAKSCVDKMYDVLKVQSSFLVETQVKENSKVQDLNKKLTERVLEKSNLEKVLIEAQNKTKESSNILTNRQNKLAQIVKEIELMEAQLGATSTTDVSIEKEVTDMETEINELRVVISGLETQFEKSRNDLQKANSNLAVKSTKDNKISDELRKISSELNNLNDEIETFEPQAIAGEQTVDNINIQIENNYIPLIEFEKENDRLKDLTQIVTESSKEIQLLTKDLYDIRVIEQNYIEKCLLDRQCKEAMAERLGVE